MSAIIDLGTKSAPLKCLLSVLIETRLLVTARSRAGKSWLLRLLIELAAPHVQVIVLDPEGEFASLREALAGLGDEEVGLFKGHCVRIRRVLNPAQADAAGEADA